MTHVIQRVIWLSTILMFVTPSIQVVQAATGLHLLFHMGVGSNGQFFVGGTLENKGDQDVHQGFVVVIPLDEECYPLPPILQPFSTIKVGEQIEFRVPISGNMDGYKLDTVGAVDHFGNKVKVIDETAETMKKKQSAYIFRCQERRNLRIFEHPDR